MRRGRQNFEFKLFGCKNVPYVGQINVGWWGKIFEGAPKSFRGRQKLQGVVYRMAPLYHLKVGYHFKPRFYFYLFIYFLNIYIFFIF